MEPNQAWVNLMTEFFTSDAVSALIEVQVRLVEETGFPEVKSFLSKVLGD